MPPDKRPPDPHSDGRGLKFEAVEHRGECPDTTLQAICIADKRDRPAIHVPMKVHGKAVNRQRSRPSAGYCPAWNRSYDAGMKRSNPAYFERSLSPDEIDQIRREIEHFSSIDDDALHHLVESLWPHLIDKLRPWRSN